MKDKKHTIEKALEVAREILGTSKGLSLGGSLGLWLQGIKLNRLNEGVTDVDFTRYALSDDTPTLRKIDGQEVSFDGMDVQGEYSGVCVEISSFDGSDVAFVEFGGFLYKVTPASVILSHKRNYANKGVEKHRKDLIEIDFILCDN